MTKGGNLMRSKEKDFIERLKNYKGWERKENV